MDSVGVEFIVLMNVNLKKSRYRSDSEDRGELSSQTGECLKVDSTLTEKGGGGNPWAGTPIYVSCLHKPCYYFCSVQTWPPLP